MNEATERLLLAYLSVEPPAPPAAGYGPLSPEAREIFWGTPDDPAPEILLGFREELYGRHYLRSDEKNHWTWIETLQGLGPCGAYAGVGTDQAYVFIGAMRPHLAWLADYDPWVVDLHRVYLAFFEEIAEIDRFIWVWEDRDEGRDWGRALLERHFAGSPDLDELLFIYGRADSNVAAQFERTIAMAEAHDFPCYLTDQATYDFVRDLVRAGRVRPVLANLLDEHALVAIGEASRQLGVPMRAFYMSNAESYWDYPDQFRTNIRAQYFDERSLIMRTQPHYPRNNDYAYSVQPAFDFLAWLADDDVDNVYDFWPREHIED
ncbi:MAG: hypothetical protein KDA28_05435, partial [Phycisphaerales bacterium]|nr:hypothetical protein [Phycisphaerales bacterium]